MWKRILGLSMTGLGVGAGARSIMGLRDLLAKPFKSTPRPAHPAVVSVRLPVAQDEEEEEVPYRRQLFPKTAEEDLGPPTILQVAGKGIKNLAHSVNPFASDIPEHSFGDWLAGRTHPSVPAKPMFWPLAVGGTGAGLIGGYKLMDKALGGLHHRDKERELEAAKEDYRRALVEQYSPESVKHGSANDDVGANLDKLWQMQKEAGGGNDVAGGIAGGYLTLAGLLAGGTGLATYNWVKGRSPEERLAKLVKQREQLRWATRPPEIYAVAKPQPVRLQAQEKTYSPGTEADEEIVHKVATAARIAAFYKP